MSIELLCDRFTTNELVEAFLLFDGLTGPSDWVEVVGLSPCLPSTLNVRMGGLFSSPVLRGTVPVLFNAVIGYVPADRFDFAPDVEGWRPCENPAPGFGDGSGVAIRDEWPDGVCELADEDDPGISVVGAGTEIGVRVGDGVCLPILLTLKLLLPSSGVWLVADDSTGMGWMIGLPLVPLISVEVRVL